MFRLLPLLLGLFGILGLSPAAQSLEISPVLAQNLINKQGSSQTWPGNRVGGGTRSDFCNVVIPANTNIQSLLEKGALPLKLVAIMPSNNLGETSLSYPRLVWYVPATAARYAEVILENSGVLEGDTPFLIYRMGFRITGEGGIYSMVIPADADIPPLETGHNYKWTLRLYCQSNEDTLDPWFDTDFDFGAQSSVSGSIYRSDVIPDSASLSNASLLDQAKVDLDQGLWFDALDKLFDRYCEVQDNPTERSRFQDHWTSLLDSVGLGLLADQPLHVHCDRP